MRYVAALVVLVAVGCSVPLAPGPATMSWGHLPSGSGGESGGGALTTAYDAGDAIPSADGGADAGDAGLE